ncbi:MAG: PAS domain S-box protein [Spirochaetaceae bacterium]|nr:MAG: PAS domain S-box protein [Spirochaetaceae bacterium]
MRKFVERALHKLSKLDLDQIRSILGDLARENERLEVVLDSMNDGVFVVDTDGVLIMNNKAGERLLPLKPAETDSSRIWNVIRDDQIAAFIEKTVQDQDSLRDREFTLDSSGSVRVLSVSVLPLVQNGKIEGTLLHVEDVSEKRAREARLRRAESLASLTTLAAGVAHEIKNPLGSIGIHLQLVNKVLDASESSEAETLREYLEVIAEEVDRLNSIVVDFLFAVRPMDIQLQDSDLNELIQEMVDFVGYELNAADIELALDLDDTVPSMCLDEKYFKQVLINLIKNAIHAMPDGGELRISTENRGDEVLLRVRDTGIGMSSDVIHKIFEPYYTTRDDGSGIGLTLVYKIIREHMGDIAVASEEGKGSTFTVSLPVPQREQHLIGWNGDTT